MMNVFYRQKFFRAVFLLNAVIVLISCASYPSEPQKPKAVEDRYDANEDSPLTVTIEDGILANDLPGEGTKVELTSVGKMPTSQQGLIELAADGSFTYTPKNQFSGTDSATYTIRNEKGGKASGTIIINVQAVNDPPGISPIANQTTPENTSINIPITVSDDETPHENLLVTSASDNDVLVPAAAMSITGEGGNRILSITPQANQVGRAAITIVVREGNNPGSLMAQTSFTLVVSDVNSPPILQPIASQTTLWMTSLTITLSIFDEETAVEALTLVATSSNQALMPDENIEFRFNRAGWEVTLNPGGGGLGIVTITITVTDNGDQDGENPQSATQSFDLEIDFPFIPFSSSLTDASLRLSNVNNEESLNGRLVEEGGGGDISGAPDYLDRDSDNLLDNLFKGHITLAADGRFTYIPPIGFSGGNIAASLGTVRQLPQAAWRVVLLNSRRAPAVQPDFYTVPEGGHLNVSVAEGLLANDIDHSGSGLTVVEPGHFETLSGGTIFIWSEGDFSYQAPPLFHGTDGLIFGITDGSHSVAGVAIFDVTD